MCGIAGIVGPGAAEHVDAVARMTAAMAHRGPDGDGLYSAPSGQCVFGHRRLAILDPSTSAAQPMRSRDDRFALTYNGEVYNYRELRRALESQGETFTSTGDTETLLRLLMTAGREAIPRLNGMFALALWDDRERRLLLARDRFGQKPLYLARVGALLIFASELRALLESGLVRRECDRQAVLGYLSFGATQGPATMVRGASLLPSASTLELYQGSVAVDRYWVPPRDKRNCSPDELREEFLAAVGRHLVSDAPLGLFLSGGIDSSAVTVAAAQFSSRALTTICVVFPDQPEASEAPHARRIAARIGSDHREIPIGGRELLALLPAALDAMDQPTADAINTFIVSHATRQAGIKVVLSGLGGDELFGGYPSFRDLPWLVQLARAPRAMRAAAAHFLALRDALDRTTAKLVDILQASADLVGVYLARRKTFSSRQVATLAPALIDGGWTAGVPPTRLPELHALVDGRELHDAIGLLELDCYMRDMLLRDSDVMGMNRSIEIRVPFLDTEFATRALQLESAARRPMHHPKWRFTEAMGTLIPRENIERRKQGFTLPFTHWMLDELRDEVEDGVAALATSGLCDEARVRQVWSRFRARPTEVGWARPWTLFILGRFLRQHRLSI